MQLTNDASSTQRLSSPTSAALRLVMLASLALASWVTGACAQAQQPVAAATEVIVTGKVSGPPLWQVKNGDHTLWIFGLLAPLPERLEFDAASIEKVIMEADQILEYPELKSSDSLGPFKAIGLFRQYRKLRVNANGQTLDRVLPADLYQRLVALHETYGPRGKRLFKMRPLLAAQLLENAARDNVGLEDSGQVRSAIDRLIKRHKIPRIESEVVTDLAYKDMLDEVDKVPLEAEIACLATTIDSLETDLDDMAIRAEAWAHGYMAELYALQFPDSQGACFSALLQRAAFDALRVRARELWIANAVRALASNRNTFAAADIAALLARNGVLDDLRNLGYDVIEP